jgi:hypothetical protein
MPVPKGTRFRVKTTKSGKKVRLAFKDGKVIEAKRLKKDKGFFAHMDAPKLRGCN